MKNEQLKQFIATEFPQMQGWCDQKKGCLMGDLIIQNGHTYIVDVGVFEGKSTLAMAKACQIQGKGLVHGVDSWSMPDCVEDEGKENAEWWSNLKLEDHYQSFLRHLERSGVSETLKICRMSSRSAAATFPDGLDMIHIDGNHSEWSSTSDVCMWLPKVKIGGHIVMDDCDWPTTQTAIRLVKKFCKHLGDYIMDESHFALFQRTK